MQTHHLERNAILVIPSLWSLRQWLREKAGEAVGTFSGTEQAKEQAIPDRLPVTTCLENTEESAVWSTWADSQ